MPSWGRRFLRRVAGVARAVADKWPLTPLGMGLAAASALVIRSLGIARQDMVFLVLGCGIAGLEALAMLTVVVTAVILRLSRPPAAPLRERLYSGVSMPTTFSLPSLGYLPFVSLRWEWVEPDAVTLERRLERGRFVEWVTFRERGEVARVVRRIIVEDVFGFSRIAFRRVEATERTVLPGQRAPLSMPLQQMLGKGDALPHPSGPPEGDPIEMRRYGAGDPMKRILWKVYARTRTLMVRVPETALSPIPRALAYLVAGEGDEPAAALARATLEARLLGADFRFGADGSDFETRSIDEALMMIVRSRAARERGAMGLSKFLRAAEPGSSVLLFAPAKKGAWVTTAVSELKKRRVHAQVVLVCDVVQASSRAGRIWKWVASSAAPPPDAATKDDLDAIIAELRTASAQVSLVERTTGRFSIFQAGRRAA